jgi:serine/threonine protein kinase
MAEKAKQVSNSPSAELERQFRHERAGMKIFIESFRDATLNLRSIPQALGQKNPDLEKRNRAIKQFKIRVQRGESPVIQDLEELVKEAYMITGKEGESIQEMPFEKIASDMRARIQQTYHGSTAASVHKKHSLKEILKKLKEKKEALRKSLEAEIAWLGEPKALKKMQEIKEPFPEGLGMSEYLSADSEQVKALPSFKKTDFSSPEEIGQGSFGKVYRTLKKRKQIVVLKHFVTHRSQDAQYELLALKGRELPDTFVLPQGGYQVRGAKVDKRFPDGSILIEYPLIEGKDPQEVLNNIDRPNPRAKAKKRTSEKGEIYDFEEPRSQAERNVTALTLLRDLAKSLQAFHEAGLVHQDIKPENMKLTKEGKIYLLDNGEVIHNKEYAEMASGSPSYMAPEMMSGYYRGSEKIDIYALGVTLYSLLTGKKSPYDGEKIMRKILVQKKEREEGVILSPEDIPASEVSEERFMKDPMLYSELLLELAEVKKDASDMRERPDKNPFHEENLKKLIYGISKELVFVIQKATDADPSNRFGSAAEMSQALDAALAKAKAQLEKLKKQQKHSDKVGDGRKERKKTARKAELIKEERKGEERKRVRETTNFGKPVSRDKPSSSESSRKPKVPKKPKAPKGKINRTGRWDEFWGDQFPEK